jgi:hypothetical protein
MVRRILEAPIMSKISEAEEDLSYRAWRSWGEGDPSGFAALLRTNLPITSDWRRRLADALDATGEWRLELRRTKAHRPPNRMLTTDALIALLAVEFKLKEGIAYKNAVADVASVLGVSMRTVQSRLALARKVEREPVPPKVQESPNLPAV